MSADLFNTYRLRRGLSKLLRLVRRQRRLERHVARFEKYLVRDKACREQIDALLLKVGCKHGEGVTCDGYDVVHNERKGAEFISRELLLVNGVDAAVIDKSLDRHKPARFATVRPMKGAEVKAA